MTTIQIGVVGAMQRSHPALTQLWLRSQGIPGLEYCSFNMTRDDQSPNPMTRIELAAIENQLAQLRAGLCDILGYAEDHVNQRSREVMVGADEEGHQNFWRYVKNREMTVVDGPLEFWWHLLVMRRRGIDRASKVLLRTLAPQLARGRVSWKGVLKPGSHAGAICKKQYEHPTALVVSFASHAEAQFDTVELDLLNLKFKAKVCQTLMELAISV